MKDIYSLGEAAKEIGMSWVWIDKQIREGKIAIVRMGGTRKIHAEEIERIKREGVKK